MKINLDKKLFKYSIYITLTSIAVFSALIIMLNIKIIFTTLFSAISSIINLIKPLLIAIIIAYLLFPLMKLFENFFKKNNFFKIKKQETRRIISILISYILIISIILSIILGIYFMIGGQLSKSTTLSNIITDISSYLNSNSLNTLSIKNTLKDLNIPLINSLEPHIIQILNEFQKYIISNLGVMSSNIMSIGSGIATFFIAFIISIYVLSDYEYFIALWKKIYHVIFRNTSTGKKISNIFAIIHNSFSKFIRGQLLEGFFVGVLSSIALAIARIDYSIIIGIIAGICNMIPYVGPLVGTVLAAIIGLLSGFPIKAIYAIVAMLIVQQIDNHLLAPKIVGQSVGLHPVFTIMAILIGGKIGGLLGMLISVPLVASIRVLFNNWYNNFAYSKNN